MEGRRGWYCFIKYVGVVKTLGSQQMKKIATWLAIFLLGTLLGGLIVWIYGGFLYRDWSFSWQWSVAGQPLATFGAGIAAIIAARIAFYNGQKTRKQDKEIHEAKSRAEQERTLRERFTSIVEMLSTTNSEDYTKRESGAYALAALADDWAIFHEDDPESARQEQQVCLNILTSQLRDPISEKSPTQLLTFKKRVQTIIFSRFKDQENESPGTWSSLELDLSNSHLYDLQTDGIFRKHVSFSRTIFKGYRTDFRGSHFCGESNFSFTKFQSTANFENSTFKELATFHHANFTSATFFDSSIFKCDLIMNSVTFCDPQPSFKSVEFHQNIRFLKASINEDATFEGSFFHLSENSQTIKFLKKMKVNLSGATFDVDFSKKKDKE